MQEIFLKVQLVPIFSYYPKAAISFLLNQASLVSVLTIVLPLAVKRGFPK